MINAAPPYANPWWSLLSVMGVLLLLSLCVEDRLKRRGLHGTGVTLKLTYANWKGISRSRNLVAGVSAAVLYRETAWMLEQVEQLPVRLIGVGIYNLSGEEDRQLTIEEFLEETGWNGQPRWVSYVLGIDADFDTGVSSDIRVEGGKVVITPAKGARKIPGLVIESRLYGSSELSGSMPFIKAARGATIEVAPFESSAKGFYRLEVSVGAQ